MKIIRNGIIPPKGFACINLFGVLWVRHGVSVNDRLLAHEAIHTAQMRELAYVGFYIIYVLGGCCGWCCTRAPHIAGYRSSARHTHTSATSI